MSKSAPQTCERTAEIFGALESPQLLTMLCSTIASLEPSESELAGEALWVELSDPDDRTPSEAPEGLSPEDGVLLRVRGQVSSAIYYEHRLRRTTEDGVDGIDTDSAPSLPLLVQSLTVSLNGGRARVAQNQLELLLELERGRRPLQPQTGSGRRDLVFALIGGLSGSALATIFLGGGDTTLSLAATLLAAIMGAALAAAIAAATRLGTLWG